MRLSKLKIKGGLVGGGVGVVLIGLFYMGKQLFHLPFLPLDFFGWLTHILPGELATVGIHRIVDLTLITNSGSVVIETANGVEQIIALTLFVLLWVVFGLVISAISQRKRFSTKQAGLSAALIIMGTLAFAFNLGGVRDPVGLAWQLLLMIGGGWAIGWILAAASNEKTAVPQHG